MIEKHMPLLEHLVELRFRVVRALYGVLVGFGACWSFSEHLMDWIRSPIKPYLGTTAGGGLVFLGVMDKFLAHVKISFWAGVILSCPYWLFHVWRFIAPGLYEKEKKYAAGFIAFGSFMFAVGVSFAYFLVFPAAFKFLLHFGGSVDQPLITLSEYLSFFVTTTLVFGLAFELPLIMAVLGMIGLINDQMLRKNRRYAIVILAVASAVLTPPDALSMFMLLVPLCLLYEISIWLVKLLGKKPGHDLVVAEKRN